LPRFCDRISPSLRQVTSLRVLTLYSSRLVAFTTFPRRPVATIGFARKTIQADASCAGLPHDDELEAGKLLKRLRSLVADQLELF